MRLEKRLILSFRWTVFTASISALFLVIWYHVATISTSHFHIWAYHFPGIPRWWDILAITLLSGAFVWVITSDEGDTHELNDDDVYSFKTVPYVIVMVASVVGLMDPIRIAQFPSFDASACLVPIALACAFALTACGYNNHAREMKLTSMTMLAWPIIFLGIGYAWPFVILVLISPLISQALSAAFRLTKTIESETHASRNLEKWLTGDDIPDTDEVKQAGPAGTLGRASQAPPGIHLRQVGADELQTLSRKVA